MAEFKATSGIWCIGIVDTRRRQGNVRYSTKRSGRVSWRRKHRLCRAKVQQPKHMHRSSPPILQRRSEMTQDDKVT